MRLNHHAKVAIDTNTFVYLIESQGAKGAGVKKLFAEMEQRRVTPVCSALMVTELLQHPLREGKELLVREYQRILFAESTIQFIAVDVPVATRAAELAARYRLKTPDAVHLACALEGGATAFVTADKGIKGIKELEIIQL